MITANFLNMCFAGDKQIMKVLWSGRQGDSQSPVVWLLHYIVLIFTCYIETCALWRKTATQSPGRMNVQQTKTLH